MTQVYQLNYCLFHSAVPRAKKQQKTRDDKGAKIFYFKFFWDSLSAFFSHVFNSAGRAVFYTAGRTTWLVRKVVKNRIFNFYLVLQ